MDAGGMYSHSTTSTTSAYWVFVPCPPAPAPYLYEFNTRRPVLRCQRGPGFAPTKHQAPARRPKGYQGGRWK